MHPAQSFLVIPNSCLLSMHPVQCQITPAFQVSESDVSTTIMYVVAQDHSIHTSTSLDSYPKTDTKNE